MEERYPRSLNRFIYLFFFQFCSTLIPRSTQKFFSVVIGDLFYLLMRKISRAEYKKSSEYRRHVTMTAMTDEGIFTVDIDRAKELFFKVRQFVEDAEKLIGGEEEEN